MGGSLRGLLCKNLRLQACRKHTNDQQFFRGWWFRRNPPKRGLATAFLPFLRSIILFNCWGNQQAPSGACGVIRQDVRNSSAEVPLDRECAERFHLHESIHYVTTSQRQIVLASAFYIHPERFVGGLPTPPSLPDATWINKPKPELLAEAPVLNNDDPIRKASSLTVWNDTKFELKVSQNHWRFPAVFSSGTCLSADRSKMAIRGDCGLVRPSALIAANFDFVYSECRHLHKRPQQY
jgi:hypothetical protein